MEFENLPKNCPPCDAMLPDDFECFRLIKGEKPTQYDFLPHSVRFPNKNYTNSPCLAGGLSVQKTLEGAKKAKKLPALKGHNRAVKLLLDNGTGKIKQTGGADHYTWWKSVDTCPFENVGANEVVLLDD